MDGGITLQDIGIFIGVLAVCALLFLAVGGQSTDRKLRQRIQRIKSRKQGAASKAADPTKTESLRRKTDTQMPLLGRVVNMFNVTSLQDRLDRAGKDISAQKYIFMSLMLLLVTALLVTLITKKPLILGIFVGIIVALGIPHMVLNYMIGKRMKRFITLFPDAIDLIVRGLRSGLPVSESINMVAREVEDPVGAIFRTMSDQMKLGVTLEKSLYDTARKLGITEFNFFVTSIVLQRETGGNLSEILNNLSDVLRKRFMMRMKIKALSSEAKASAIIVGALPFVVIVVLNFLQPDYMDPLFDDYRGNIAALGAACMQIFGITVMIKMTKFEI